MVKQTVGRDALTGFGDEFAYLNDDILFGEVWSRVEHLSFKERSLITISTLIGKGFVDLSLKYHLEKGKKN